MIFIFAGHGGLDTGAIGVDRRTEARETLKLRNAVCDVLRSKNVPYRIDDDNDKLSQVLKKAVTGSGSVVLDIHFNSHVNAKATGVECIVADNADATSVQFAKEIVNSVTLPTGLTNRGIKKEGDTPRKRLGVMREKGIVCLLETCFISNPDDMRTYDAHMQKIAENIANVLIKYEAMRG
jgi:N-acetylmuramoyl-L-alanine amidase